jgi:hypothetical protein
VSANHGLDLDLAPRQGMPPAEGEGPPPTFSQKLPPFYQGGPHSLPKHDLERSRNGPAAETVTNADRVCPPRVGERVDEG